VSLTEAELWLGAFLCAFCIWLWWDVVFGLTPDELAEWRKYQEHVNQGGES